MIVLWIMAGVLLIGVICEGVPLLLYGQAHLDRNREQFGAALYALAAAEQGWDSEVEVTE